MEPSGPAFWRVHCHIGHHPGQWQYWFREQCCAVGWHPPVWKDQRAEGWTFDDDRPGDPAWSAARNALKKIRLGDWVVATLPGARVGRLGTVVGMAVRDEQWDPIVPARKDMPYGENGRRILMRWDLATGPDDPSKVVTLPEDARLNSGEIRSTIRSLPIEKLEPIRRAMNDESNWTSLGAAFALEAALSDYIAIHPYRLESGMIAHPYLQARELTFGNRQRTDVILQDRAGRVVIVECKQGSPSLGCLEQVANYRRLLQAQDPGLAPPRALLVHGGSARVHPDIASAASTLGVELINFDLQVNFAGRR